MPLDKRNIETQTGLFKGQAIWNALLTEAPTVAKFLAQPHLGMVNFKLTYRGENDFMAVAKQYGEDGRTMVCFGSGVDAVGCILGLEVAIDQDKWRPDKWANK